MIAALKGTVFEKDEGKILLDVKDVIYELNVSMHTFSEAEKEGVFYISEIIKENEYTLYAFKDKNEQKMFNTLIKLNGIGPKVALAVCSAYTPQTFAGIVASQDINALKKVPGIGPKVAKRILIEMGEFSVNVSDPDKAQAVIALENLGFNKNEIIKATADINGSVEEIIKEALKRLSKGMK